MRCLAKNKQDVYYALLTGETDILDTDGNETGEKTLTYSSAVQVKMNVSGKGGSAVVMPYGLTVNFDRKMVTDDMSCPITETSRVWLDIVPESTIPPNYKVVCVSTTLNSKTFYLKEIEQ